MKTDTMILRQEQRQFGKHKQIVKITMLFNKFKNKNIEFNGGFDSTL